MSLSCGSNCNEGPGEGIKDRVGIEAGKTIKNSCEEVLATIAVLAKRSGSSKKLTPTTAWILGVITISCLS